MKKQKHFSFHIGSVANYSASDKLIFTILTFFLLYMIGVIFYQLIKIIYIEIPSQKGVVVEGVLGTPINLNPLFAETRAEKDISYLLHGSLVKNPTASKIIPSIASSWSVSNDGLTYTFILNEKAIFNTGDHVTAKDVVFTITLLENIDSTIANEWEGIKAIELSNNKVEIQLPNIDPDFIYKAILPILPYKNWYKVDPKNLKTYQGTGFTVGAGLYKLKTKYTTIDGLITQIVLEKADQTLEKPYIQNIIFRFFENRNDLVDAFENGYIDSISNITPTDLKYILKNKNNKFTVLSGHSRKVFGLFYNHRNDSVFNDIFLRGIFSEVIDKKGIVDDVFNGFASVLTGPTPNDISTQQNKIHTTVLKNTLNDLGWKNGNNNVRENENGESLNIRIILPDAEEFIKIAEHIKVSFESLGSNVTLERFGFNDISSLESLSGYDAILYGYDYPNSTKSLEKIWLNNSFLHTIAGFDNISTIFNKEHSQNRNILYTNLKKIITKEIPSVFIYSPHFVYVFNKEIYGITSKTTDKENIIFNSLDQLNDPSDRFNKISEWYTNTKHLLTFNLKYHNKI